MDTDFDSAVTGVRAGQVTAAGAAAGLVSRLSEAEKLWLVDGDQSFWRGMAGWWGQRKLDRDGHQAAYPLGFGLGYTTFTVTDLEVVRTGPVAADGSGTVLASVAVTNTGTREGSTVIQLYALTNQEDPHGRPGRQLLGFTRVHLPTGATTRAQVHGSLRPLARRDPATGTWSPVPGSYQLEAAQHSGDPQAATADLPLTIR